MASWKSLTLLLVCLWSAGTIAAQPEASEHYEVVIGRNISYAHNEESHPRRVLDIYLPDGAENFPLLMFVSGGGWTQGSKDWVANVGMAFARRGIAVATVDHRLVPEVTYEGQVEDLSQAFVWLRENIGEVRGDSSHIVIGGHSAGAHLISMLAVNPQFLGALDHDFSEISGVIAISGIYRFRPSVIGSGIIPDRVNAVEAAAPLTHIQPGLPPFLLLYASDEMQETKAQAEQMHDALAEAGVSAISAEIPDRDHFTITQMIGAPGDPATQIIVDWMKSQFATASRAS